MLNQHCFINQMMKGGCNSEIKGEKKNTTPACTVRLKRVYKSL